MKGLALSCAAAGLVRTISRQAETTGHRILLTEVRSIDWQSLTFTGERHEMAFTLAGNDARRFARRLLDSMTEAEFAIPGHIVADIAGKLLDEQGNSSVSVAIEALTILE